MMTSRCKGRRLISPAADSAYSPDTVKARARAIVNAYRSQVYPKHKLFISSRMSYALNASSRKKRHATCPMAIIKWSIAPKRNLVFIIILFSIIIQIILFTPGSSRSNHVSANDKRVVTTPMNMNLPKAPIHTPSNIFWIQIINGK